MNNTVHLCQCCKHDKVRIDEFPCSQCSDQNNGSESHFEKDTGNKEDERSSSENNPQLS